MMAMATKEQREIVSMLNRQGCSTARQAQRCAAGIRWPMRRPPAGLGSQPRRARRADQPRRPTFTGTRTLAQEELVVLEIGRLDCTGVDRRAGRRSDTSRRPGAPRAASACPAVRAGGRAPSRAPVPTENDGIDTGLFPLGSCTMNTNARRSATGAAAGLRATSHLLQPVSTVQGALDVDGHAGARSDDAGQHAGRGADLEGRACQMLGDHGHQGRDPGEGRGALPGRWCCAESGARHQPGHRSAPASPSSRSRHGTTAGCIWTTCRPRSGPALWPDHAHQPEHLPACSARGPATAEAIHAAGAYFYCRCVNFTPSKGVTIFGVDAMHINLHKTFSRRARVPGVATPAVFARVPFVRLFIIQR